MKEAEHPIFSIGTGADKAYWFNIPLSNTSVYFERKRGWAQKSPILEKLYRELLGLFRYFVLQTGYANELNEINIASLMKNNSWSCS